MVSLGAEEERQGDMMFPPVGVSSEALGLAGTLPRFTVCDRNCGPSFDLLAVGFPQSGAPRYLPRVVCSKIRKLEAGA